MPDVGRYKHQKNWMQDCMRQNIKKEKKTPEQSAAKCLNIWRSKSALKIVQAFLSQAKYIREKEKGTPGKSNYKPSLWYWITPEGKKKLVDQKNDV